MEWDKPYRHANHDRDKYDPQYGWEEGLAVHEDSGQPKGGEQWTNYSGEPSSKKHGEPALKKKQPSKWPSPKKSQEDVDKVNEKVMKQATRKWAETRLWRRHWQMLRKRRQRRWKMGKEGFGKGFGEDWKEEERREGCDQAGRFTAEGTCGLGTSLSPVERRKHFRGVMRSFWPR